VTADAWRDLAAIAAFLIAGPLVAGALLGYIVDAALQLRALRSTGHVLDCLGLGGWPCDCRDSEPAPGRIGQREHDGGAPAAGLLVLPDAGPPPAWEGARVPGLRPPGRAEHPSSRGH